MTDASKSTDAARRPVILGIGGTTRSGSSSEIALRISLEAAEALGCEADIVAGDALDLPSYDPVREERSARAQRLVAALRRADGVLLSTPSYHCGFSGMIKNALDYAEDMRGDARPYLDGRAVGVIVTAYGAQGLGTALASMRSVIHALRGWPTPYAATLNTALQPFEEGRPTNPDVADQLAMVAGQVVEFARMRRALAAERAVSARED